jgi:hypothetical protein
MNSSYHIIRIKNILAYVFLIVISIQYAFVNTELEFTGLLSTLVMLFESIIFCSYLLFRKYKKRTLTVIVILLLLSGMTYYATGSTSFIIMLMTAIFFDKLDYSHTFRLIFFVRLIMLLVIITCAGVGILDVFERSIMKDGSHTVIGYGLGFTHPNRLAFVFEYLSLIFICYKNDKIKNRHFFSLICFTLLGYGITKSRTLLFSILGVILFVYLYRSHFLHRILKIVLNKLSLLIMPLCATISIVIPMLMHTAKGQLQTILYAINGLLSSRFTHIYRAFLNYPVTLFGGVNDFTELQDIYHFSTIDNGYIRLLYGFGIIGFAIFIIFTFITIRRLIKQGEYIYIIVYIVISLWGVSENVLASFAFNFFIAFWSQLLKSNSVIESKEGIKVYESKQNRISDII